MDYQTMFRELIAAFLAGRLSRAAIEKRMAFEVPIDAIKGDPLCLMPNCEEALRHINEPEYYNMRSGNKKIDLHETV